MKNDNDEYYRNLIKDMNEEEKAVGFVLSKVRAAINNTQRTRKRVNKALDLMSISYESR